MTMGLIIQLSQKKNNDNHIMNTNKTLMNNGLCQPNKPIICMLSPTYILIIFNFNGFLMTATITTELPASNFNTSGLCFAHIHTNTHTNTKKNFITFSYVIVIICYLILGHNHFTQKNQPSFVLSVMSLLAQCHRHRLHGLKQMPRQSWPFMSM